MKDYIYRTISTTNRKSTEEVSHDYDYIFRCANDTCRRIGIDMKIQRKENVNHRWKTIHIVKNMTAEEKWKEIYDVLDGMGVKYDTNQCNIETEALIEFWTDTAGQDIITEFNYDGTPEDFVKQFTERAENYDVDEEVEIFVDMRGRNGVPNTVRELLDDCQEAKDTLMEIATKLQNAL